MISVYVSGRTNRGGKKMEEVRCERRKRVWVKVVRGGGVAAAVGWGEEKH